MNYVSITLRTLATIIVLGALFYLACHLGFGATLVITIAVALGWGH